MNQLARVSPASGGRPAPADPQLRRAIHGLLGCTQRVGGRLVLLGARPIAPRTRDALEARLHELDRCLGHRNDRALDVAVTGLTMLFSGTRADADDDTDTIVRMYLRVLEDLPAWAVVEAIEAIGRPTDGRRHEYAPSAATIHSLAYVRCRLWLEERDDIRAILEATPGKPEPDERERARVEAMLAATAETLRMENAMQAAEERAARERRRAEVPAPEMASCGGASA